MENIKPLAVFKRSYIMQTISILGSTGSIGTQALEVAKKHKIRVKALAARSNVKLLAQQVKDTGAEYACIFDEEKLPELERELAASGTSLLSGSEGLKTIARLDGIDKMLNSVVGMVGLEPTLEAIEAGTDIALANKETLVAGGELVMKRAAEKGVKIYPVDSEHSAIFQCLQGNKPSQLTRIILTASGGPFYKRTRAELADVTVKQALSHPNWNMGDKITIDSATLMNKGLEFIEAMRLFDIAPEQIEIVVHRQSVVHSAVQYADRSVIAQMGVPDMKIPIQYALMYPDRLDCPTDELSLTDYGTLTFEKPDTETFDCLRACIKAASLGGIMPAAVNAANEVAVRAFLDGRIGFLQIGELVMSTLENTENRPCDSLEAVLEADRAAREYTENMIERL